MKVVVVGASSGLGAAILLRHASNGHEVIGVGRTIDRISEALEAYQNARTFTCDVTVQSNLSDLHDLCEASDVIYYCAAQIDPAPPKDIFNVNFLAFAELVKGLAYGKQRIVAISSLAAVISFEEIANYCASKAALEAWINALPEKQYKRILLVRPGKFDSDLFVKSDKLDIGRLPHAIAQSICDISLTRSGIVNLGGFRDQMACLLAPIVGQALARRLLG